MIMLSIKLADFIKDSLQGLFNQWGGINETGVAEEAFNKAMTEWGFDTNFKSKNS